jgi:hypothetical protein
MEDKSYELFSELLDREHESLIPDKTIPTFNIWDIRKDKDEYSRTKTQVPRVTRLQTTSK